MSDEKTPDNTAKNPVVSSVEKMAQEVTLLEESNEAQRVAAQGLIEELRASEAERVRLNEIITQKDIDLNVLVTDASKHLREIDRQKDLVADAFSIGKTALTKNQFLERRLDFAEKQLRSLLDIVDSVFKKN